MLALFCNTRCRDVHFGSPVFEHLGKWNCSLFEMSMQSAKVFSKPTSNKKGVAGAICWIGMMDRPRMDSSDCQSPQPAAKRHVQCDDGLRSSVM